MRDRNPPPLGRFDPDSLQRAPQRSAWTPEQLQALRRLDEALEGERLDEKTAHGRRKWVEWFLRWQSPQSWREATPAALARFLERQRRRRVPRSVLRRVPRSVLRPCGEAIVRA